MRRDQAKPQRMSIRNGMGRTLGLISCAHLAFCITVAWLWEVKRVSLNLFVKRPLVESDWLIAIVCAVIGLLFLEVGHIWSNNRYLFQVVANLQMELRSEFFSRV